MRENEQYLRHSEECQRMVHHNTKLENRFDVHRGALAILSLHTDSLCYDYDTSQIVTASRKR
jgi:hypothetical protein